MDGGDSDDDRQVASSSANAGFGVPEEDPNVDLALDLDEHFDIDQGKDRRVWLVKVPKFLLEKWQNVKSNNEELGRLRVYKKPMPNGEERIVMLLPPNKEGDEPIPTEYFMTIQNKATQNTYIFAERDDVTVGEAGWEPGKGRIKRGADGDGSEVPEKRRKPTLTGVVHHECNLTPRVDSESYRAILRERQAKAAEPKRRAQLLTTDDQELKRLGMAGMASANKKFDSFYSKPKEKEKAAAAQKLVRLPRNELLDMLFSAFEQFEYWTMKSLRSHTQQPEGYLKMVLSDIAQLNRRGPYAGHYSLLEEYKKKKEGEGDESAPKAEGSGTTGPAANGVKKEEGVEEETKPDISDDDDDDIEMEQVP